MGLKRMCVLGESDPDEEEEEEGVFKRSKAWNYVKVTGQGTAMHNGVMKAYKDIQ